MDPDVNTAREVRSARPRIDSGNSRRRIEAPGDLGGVLPVTLVSRPPTLAT